MMYHIKANFQGALRQEIWQGEVHLVVPVVMIVEGVLNGALVPASEFGKYPEAWNGRPVPVLHPEDRGVPISANRPDIIERNTIGSIFNTYVDGLKLKCEAWLNVEKAKRLGLGDLIEQLEAGEVVEVSTGYFAEDDGVSGEYNGVAYTSIHRNIRPDHLALLPGQEGACSVADGCGTRVNSKRSSLAMKVNEAWAALGHALGLNVNCQCEENNSMDILKEAEKLVKANALDAKQLAAVQKMDPSDREVMAAFIAALQMAGDPGEVEEMEDELEDEEVPANMGSGYEGKNMGKKAEAPKTMSQADIDKMVANKVDEHLRRRDVTTKLVANEKNSLTEDQMAGMTVDQLEAVEKMIRPADYSGAGGFASNATREDNVTPLGLRGVLSKKKEA